MTIKTKFQINILISICLALLVGGVLLFADRKIDREMKKTLLADQITRSVFDLFMASNSYFTYREERPRIQWNLKLTSLKKLIREAQTDEGTGGGDLAFLLQRCDEMDALFEKTASFAEKMGKASGEEAVLTREAYERLVTNLTAKGQEMVNLAFLLILESNQSLSGAKEGVITLVMVSILLAIGTSTFISLFLSRRILTDLQFLQEGTEIAAGGDLDHRVDIRSQDEIGLLTHSFNEMTRRLNESERERDAYLRKLAQSNRDLEEFAFVASHDLQEPLRKIQTFGDRLKEKWGDSIGEAGRDYLDRMHNAAVRMQDLILALLAYSRVSTRPEPFSQVALAPVVQAVVSDLAAHIEQTGGRVEVGELPVVESSPHQIRQLFQNLLSNSLKYHSEKKPIIRVVANEVNDAGGEKASPKGPWVEIRVEDNGIGFDEKYLDRIFMPFQRLHGRREYEGSGMGLAICQKIVERHGGTITAKSAPGKGATFIIALPSKQPLKESSSGLREELERGGEGGKPL